MRPKNQTRVISTQSAPVSKATSLRVGAPNIIRKQNGDILISHREYVSDVIGTNGTAFPLPTADGYQSFRINPSNPGLFPWLSNIAPEYEMYKFTKLHIEYEAACSTSVPGVVLIGIDYDPADAPPTSKQQIMSYESSVKTNAWNSVTHSSTQRNLSRQKEYITDFFISSIPDGRANRRLTDVGNLFVISSQNGTGNGIGELYVSYTVHLQTPQLGGASGSAFQSYCAFANPFYPGTQFHGDINMELTSNNDFELKQRFEGIVQILQYGTSITTPPGLHLDTGPGITLLLDLEYIDPDATRAFAQYLLVGDPQAVYEVSTGSAFSLAGWRVRLIEAPMSIINALPS